MLPVFNPLCTEEARKLKLLPIPTVMKHVNTVEDRRAGGNEMKMTGDDSDRTRIQFKKSKVP